MAAAHPTFVTPSSFPMFPPWSSTHYPVARTPLLPPNHPQSARQHNHHRHTNSFTKFRPLLSLQLIAWSRPCHHPPWGIYGIIVPSATSIIPSMLTSQSLRTLTTHDGRGRPKNTLSQLLAVTSLAANARKPPKMKANKLFTKVYYGGPVSHRPGLGRSKLTDGLIRQKIKQNSRSMTRLLGLQPITKTLSGGAEPTLTSTMSHHPKSRSTLSLRGLLVLPPHVGLKTSARKGKAILQLNDDHDDDEYEDVGATDDEASVPATRGFVTPNPDPNTSQSPPQATETSTNVTTDHSSDHLLPGPVPGKHVAADQFELVPDDVTVRPKFSPQESTDDLLNGAAYGGSLLLSQSTGLTRKIDLHRTSIATSPETKPVSPSVDESNEKLNPSSSHNDNVASAPSQTSSSSSEPLAGPTAIKRKPTPKFSNNFSSFLAPDTHTHTQSDTRTQQRLWLQRENSLMDVPHLDANNLNNFSNLSLSNLMFAHNQSTTNMTQFASGSSSGSKSNILGDSNDVTPSGSSGGAIGSTTGGEVSLQGALQGALVTTPSTTSEPTNLNQFLRSVLSSNSRVLQKMELERFSREYLSVRRYQNPVAELLDRINHLNHTDQININKRERRQKPLLKLSDIEAESSAIVLRLWQEAVALCTGPSGYPSHGSLAPRITQSHDGSTQSHRPIYLNPQNHRQQIPATMVRQSGPKFKKQEANL